MYHFPASGLKESVTLQNLLFSLLTFTYFQPISFMLTDKKKNEKESNDKGSVDFFVL